MPEVKNTQNGELQKIQLNILREFDLFCREHNIKYISLAVPPLVAFVTKVLFLGMMISMLVCLGKTMIVLLN